LTVLCTKEGVLENLPFFLSQFYKVYVDWRVALDILLIAAALFFIYRTLQRVGAWKIMVGVLSAAAIFALAHFLNLRGIRWAYSNLSQVAVVGVIVVFQPEIRKVFERAASLKRSHRARGEPMLADLLAHAAFSLAKKKRGALLVLPGRDNVIGSEAGGYVLDATPSLPLLMSIFDPNSPGHDGAVVVENGRLARLGVRLPLSSSGALSPRFGTRHHAAMGLSEATDALIIAVSEERGQVSIFREGRISVPEDRQELAGAVRSHWDELHASPLGLKGPGRSRTKGRPLPRPRTKTIPEIAMAVFLAVILWTTLIYSQSEILERSFTVPIEFTATPANVALVGDKPSEIKLHLVGPKADLDSLDASQLMVKISLAEAMPGKQTVAINEDNVRLRSRNAGLFSRATRTTCVSLKPSKCWTPNREA
jgi:uncharacterized protein (TIGR00159 family)